MTYTVQKSEAERVRAALIAAGYRSHHVSYSKGYVSRRTAGIISHYDGGYPAFLSAGICLVWDIPSLKSTAYFLREYWSRERDSD